MQNRSTSTHTPPGPILIGYGELCLMLGISRRHAKRMVDRGELPKPRLSGTRQLFVVAEVVKAVEALPTRDA